MDDVTIDVRGAIGRTCSWLSDILKGESSDVPVVMLGPRRTGKTTLLTVMYERFESTADAAGLLLEAEDEHTTEVLDRGWEDLEEMVGTGTAEISPGLAATETAQTFAFRLTTGKARLGTSDLPIRFVDYPGGWLYPTDPNHDFVIRYLQQALVAIVAIDTPYLMEDRGDHHYDRHLPEVVTNMLTSHFLSTETQKLLILAPLRCEKYVGTPARDGRLRDQVRAQYKALIERASAPGSQITIVVTPVQTTGCVVFSHWVENRPPPPSVAPVFRARVPNPVYAPIDSDQPLRYILAFAVREYLRATQTHWSGRVRRWMRLDAHLVRALHIFVRGCKTDGGFEVIADSYSPSPHPSSSSHSSSMVS